MNRILSIALTALSVMSMVVAVVIYAKPEVTLVPCIAVMVWQAVAMYFACAIIMSNKSTKADRILMFGSFLYASLGFMFGIMKLWTLATLWCVYGS